MKPSDSITPYQFLLEFLRRLGLDVDEIEGVTVRADWGGGLVEATRLKRDADGRPIADGDRIAREVVSASFTRESQGAVVPLGSPESFKEEDEDE